MNAIINDYFNSFEIRKYYINKYEQPYYGVLSYLHDIGYTVEYELLQEAHLQDSFDTATRSVDVKELYPSCKITVIFQCKKGEEKQVNLPESMMRIIKANHGDYMLSNRGELWNSTMLLPLKRKERRKDEQG